ncbi:MAG: hypothetical protein WC626_08995 [Methanoregula sp.]
MNIIPAWWFPLTTPAPDPASSVILFRSLRYSIRDGSLIKKRHGPPRYLGPGVLLVPALDLGRGEMG